MARSPCLWYPPCRRANDSGAARSAICCVCCVWGKVGKNGDVFNKTPHCTCLFGKVSPTRSARAPPTKKKTKPHRLLVSVSSVSRLTFPPFAFCLFLSCLNASKAWSCHGSDAPGLDSRALEGIVRGPRAIQGLAFWWRASAPSAFGNKAAGRAPARPNERQD